MAFGFPKISITFKQVAASAIKAGSRGVVALILKDTNAVATAVGNKVLMSVTEIPVTLSAYNKAQITDAFIGGVNPPKKVIIVVQDTAVVPYTTSLDYLETQKFDYLAVPGIAGADVTTVSTWIKGLRDTKAKKVKAVLPSSPSDHEGIINAVTDVKKGATTVTAKDTCARLAGVFAGTPLVTSATFYSIPEYTDTVLHPTEDAIGADVDLGKLVLCYDGEKVKIARAVNSLTTTTSDKGEAFKKIKIVDILDLVATDVRKTIQDNYIGKVSNTYNNKLLLINAINGYFAELEANGYLDKEANLADIDVIAQKNYLASTGVAVDDLSISDIRIYNTGSNVFIAAKVKPLDAMEDITLVVNL